VDIVHARAAAPTTDELLAQLPPLPDVTRPFFGGPAHLATDLGREDLEHLRELISERFLDWMLAELTTDLPSVADALRTVGPSGVALRARPSNTINALTVPTRDGVLIVYNIGLYSMLHSVASVVSQEATAPSFDDFDAFEKRVDWLSSMVDWATSPAAEPRILVAEMTDDQRNLAANMAGRAQRFAMCHELGHALDVARRPTDTVRPAEVQGVAVSAVRDAWDREFEADAAGLAMLVQALEARKRDPVGALIGAELFLNTAGMLQASAEPSDATSHPPADDRLAHIRQQFLHTLGERALEVFRPAAPVRQILERLRGAVDQAVQSRRSATEQELQHRFARYAASNESMDNAERAAFATDVAHLLLNSPTATLRFLQSQLAAPPGADEPAAGSPQRLLAYNAALNFEPALRAAIGLNDLR
jgi:hypothetical protein